MEGIFLEPVLVRVLFPAVFVQVLVQVLVEFLVLFRHRGPADFDCSIKCRGVGRMIGLPARLLALNSRSIAIAAGIVRGGGLIVYPTDTVYGLGCDPSSDEAVERLFRVKGRGSKPVPVLCSSTEKAAELVELTGRAMVLARAHWPGALTIVAPLRTRLPAQLTQGTSKLGVRVPAHAACLKLISSCGGWLTGTSANISGRPSATSASEAGGQLGSSVDLILDGGPSVGKESTVIQVVGEAVTILRTGPVGVGDEMKGRRTS